MPHKKPHLPEKICPVCQRSFTWRKKWERFYWLNKVAAGEILF